MKLIAVVLTFEIVDFLMIRWQLPALTSIHKKTYKKFHAREMGIIKFLIWNVSKNCVSYNFHKRKLYYKKFLPLQKNSRKMKNPKFFLKNHNSKNSFFLKILNSGNFFPQLLVAISISG